ncbi:ADP-forming succinate--CoA ligase subunit beta [Candidatus Blochmannia ocreatus (nom. nud.)]|uniref:Succinate--CoA ligase [ADP-forming] subunit beta n=1 Tax=Candidatus Blochmannia ocreatus (nom. nud.) TaxID=251538 RepID=A0ABY4SWF4_9ENTR|nr:ADP-forming succinate--CoA ligase subunit beta [Candidatus Blochmannia ocreatus]URJ25393.1 ADP-forming succinate--CoA ligase subunit beta [Candidatus Blochmannia ocreatus]
MNLYEYQAKKLLKKYNLPIPNGYRFSAIDDVKNHILSNQISTGPWVLKCQIQSGGRGKAGGVQIVHSKKEILSFTNKWLGKTLKTYQTADSGELVQSILIEPAIEIIQELYLSILIDREKAQITCMISKQGGVNIEQISQKTPHLIYKIKINPISGLQPYQGRILACKIGLSDKKINKFAEILVKATQMFLEKELTLIEINPLAITNENNFICLDAKITIDPNAIFRQPELFSIYTEDNIHTQQEVNDFNYIPLTGGNIGCMINGAGLAMATMDMIKSLGGTPANFLDIGGNSNKNSIISAFHAVLTDSKVKAILVNIFGGIICCDLVADSVLTTLSRYYKCIIKNNMIPIVFRLEGNNAELGKKRLINSNLNIYVTNNLIDAIQQVIKMVKFKNVNID